MAETVAGTYATIAGTEFVNNYRTMTYLRNGLGPSSLNVYGDCSSCVNIAELIDCPGVSGYTSPELDDAPWYTPSIPESKDFLGFYVEEFTGLNSPFIREVTESVGHGGILSRSRLKTREMTWTGYLFGKTCCSVRYGYKWLSQILAQFNTACQDCFGDDMELLVCCPDQGETIWSPIKTLKGVGLVEGPLIQSERATCSTDCSSGCGGSCIVEIEFTMVAAQPYLYSEPIAIYDCIPFSEGTFDVVTDPEEPCPPFDCVDQVFSNPSSAWFGNCSTQLPPTARYENSCFDILTTGLGPALYLTVPRSSWPVLEEVVPVITISNNSGFVNSGIKIGFYQSSDGNPCGDLFLNPPGCAVMCDELLIGPIPPSSSFYIDGRTRKMAAICEDGTAFPGERLTNGPWSWPTFNNFGFCMEIQFINTHLDGSGASIPPLAAPEMCVSLSLVPRSF